MIHKSLSASVVLWVIALLALCCMIAASAQVPATGDTDVRVVPNEAARRVDVFVGKQLFTAYVYPNTLKKPVLFPIRTARGNLVTRGFPLVPTPGERVDHPHQVGLWFNYGDVNGLDFWNNSDAVEASQREKR